MIQNTLKPCCNECMYPEIEVDTDNFLGEKTCTIYCAHAVVCKDYIESEEE